jgi:hypothetical protein
MEAGGVSPWMAAAMADNCRWVMDLCEIADDRARARAGKRKRRQGIEDFRTTALDFLFLSYTAH